MTAHASGGMGDLIARKQVVICAGSGGVGKTTVSAAIAAGAAAQGKKAVVLTIDPARRLANALGLPELGNEERRVKMDAEGELWALTLDAKRTFDDLVDTYSRDEQTRRQVLENPIYRQLSNAVAGSQEYMAMEKLHELHQEGKYDLLVLDTPPTRNALDFLDAPGRLMRFVDSRSLSFFRASSRMGAGIMGRGTGVLFSVMKKATGVDLLRDVAEFFDSFDHMTEGFRERAERVDALICDSRTTFLLVTSPRSAAIEEAGHFHRKLQSEGLPFGGVIVNRMREQVRAKPAPELHAELAEMLDEKLAAKVVRNLSEHRLLAERDALNVKRLRERLGRSPIVTVPELSGDVHDLAGITELNAHLFSTRGVTR
ncbi:MAG: AAA family ATPase [Actinomycetota bacterium]|nr:AAA family ATPase [Actinomycetota bacterium]